MAPQCGSTARVGAATGRDGAVPPRPGFARMERCPRTITWVARPRCCWPRRWPAPALWPLDSRPPSRRAERARLAAAQREAATLHRPGGPSRRRRSRPGSTPGATRPSKLRLLAGEPPATAGACGDTGPLDRGSARGAPGRRRSRRRRDRRHAPRQRADPGAARARARPARRRGRARPDLPGQLQPDEGQGAGLRRPRHRRWDRRRPGRLDGRAPATIASPVTFEEAAALPVTDLQRRPDQGSHPRIGRQRRRAARLRRRRPPRHLSRHRRRADAGARAHPAPQRALSQSRRLEVRGRVGAGRRRRRGLGQRRLRRRRRRRRPPRSLRHQLGRRTCCSATAATARSRTSRRAPASPPAAGAPAARSSTPTPTATSTSTSRATSRRPGTRSSRAQRTLVWRNGPRDHGRPGRPARRGRSVLREPRQRPLPRRHRGARPRPIAARAYGFGVVATDYDDDGLRRSVRGQRLEPELPVSQPSARRPLRERRADRRRRGERRSARPGRHGRRRRRLRRRRPHRSRADGVRARSQHALSQRRRPAASRTRAATARHRRAPRSRAWAGARPSSTPTSTAGSISFFANGHIFADVDRFPQLGETYRQKNQLLLNHGATLPRRVGRAGGGLQTRARRPRPGRRRSRRRRRSRHRREQHGRRRRRCSRTASATGRHWVAFRVAAPAGNRFAIGAKVTVTSAGDAGRCARSARAAAICRRAICARCSGSAMHAGPVSVEVRHAGRRRWRGRSCRRSPARARADGDRIAMRPRRLRRWSADARRRRWSPWRCSRAAAADADGAEPRRPAPAVYRPALQAARVRSSRSRRTARAGQRRVPAEPIAAAIEARLRELRRGAARTADRAVAAVERAAGAGLPRRAAVPRRIGERRDRRSNARRCESRPARRAALDARAFAAELRRLVERSATSLVDRVPRHRHRPAGRRRPRCAPTSATTSSAPARGRGASSTSACGGMSWRADRRRAGRSSSGRRVA